MNRESQILLDRFGTTEEIFIDTSVKAVNMDEPMLNAVFKECMDLLLLLGKLKEKLLPFDLYLVRHPEEDWDEEEYEGIQIDFIDEFAMKDLSQKLIDFETGFFSTKPVVISRFHIFLDMLYKLKSIAKNIADTYILEPQDSKEMSGYIEGCIYNLSCFLIIQFNLECVCLGWDSSVDCNGKIAGTVLRYCEANQMELAEVILMLSVAYNSTRTKFAVFEGKHAKEIKFLNKIRYLAIDLEDIPELVTEKRVSDILNDKEELISFESEIYNKIEEKYSQQC